VRDNIRLSKKTSPSPSKARKINCGCDSLSPDPDGEIIQIWVIALIPILKKKNRKQGRKIEIDLIKR